MGYRKPSSRMLQLDELKQRSLLFRPRRSHLQAKMLLGLEMRLMNVDVRMFFMRIELRRVR